MIKISPVQLILIISILTLVSCERSFDIVSIDLKNRNLNGKIKTLSTTYYDGVNESDTIEKGEQRSRTKEEFDRYGNLISTRWYHYVSTESFTGETGPQIDTILFNSKGRIIAFRSLDSHGNVIRKSSFSYNLNTKTITEKTFVSEKLESVRNSIYNNQGLLIESNFKKVDSPYKYKFTYSYDGNGNLVKYIEYRENSIVFKRDVKYTSKNTKLEEREYYENGTITLSKFNNQGDQVESSTFNKNDTTEHLLSSYQYDKVGNWIKRVNMSTRPINNFICERTIDYYSN